MFRRQWCNGEGVQQGSDGKSSSRHQTEKDERECLSGESQAQRDTQKRLSGKSCKSLNEEKTS